MKTDIFLEESLVFKVVIVYENFATAVRAKEVAERLVRYQLKCECLAWSFESLAERKVREHYATVAAGADMVIFTCRGREDLPDHVKEWIEDWLVQKQEGPVFLVALLDEAEMMSGETPSAIFCLREIAERGGMEFFSNADYWQQPKIVELAGARTQDQAAWQIYR